MTKHQWKDLWHRYRAMRRYATKQETLAWISFYNPTDAALLIRILE